MYRVKIRVLTFCTILFCAVLGCSRHATSGEITRASTPGLDTPSGETVMTTGTEPATSMTPTTGDLPGRISPTASAPPLTSRGDERIAWLQTKAISVRSIDPADEAYPDLEPLKEIIGDSQVVLLGEASHGDGSTFLAKTRMVKFLHQEMGFLVLAIESGFYDCMQAWEQIEGGSDTYPSLKQALFPIWMDSQQFWGMVQYIDEVKHSSNPLEVSGFDCQFTGEASRDNLIPDLEAFLAEREIPLADSETWNHFTRVLRYLVSNSTYTGSMMPDETTRDSFRETIDHLVKSISSHNPEADLGGDTWVQLLETTKTYADWVWEYAARGADTSDPKILELRDVLMAKNLLWLMEHKYPGQKIIVWSAAFHNARSLERIEVSDPELQPIYDQANTMGDILSEELGDSMYSIAFTSSQGQTGYPWDPSPTPLETPSPGSLENLLDRAGFDFAFIDLRDLEGSGAWLREELAARPFGHEEMRADWTAVFDGVFFIREMEPSSPLSATSLVPETESHPPAEAVLGDTWTRPTDGMLMVYVPGGSHPMGSSAEDIHYAQELCDQYPDSFGKCAGEDFSAETPQHTATTGSFWIDQTEITSQQYLECVQANACQPSQTVQNSLFQEEGLPAAGIPWYQADAYCTWVGGRLPTEAEWEYAASGPEGLTFPWGEDFSCSAVNLYDAYTGCDDGYPQAAPVGGFPEGESWCGALDLSGNMWEWVLDDFSPYPSSEYAQTSKEELKILRGGSWGYPPAFARTSYRYPVPPDADYRAVGFRCVVAVGGE